MYHNQKVLFASQQNQRHKILLLKVLEKEGVYWQIDRLTRERSLPKV